MDSFSKALNASLDRFYRHRGEETGNPPPHPETDSGPAVGGYKRFDDPASHLSENGMVERQIASRDVTDADVLAAMRAVPRYEFVPVELRESAYEDGALPIGHGQTISQPYIVALMTELLQLKKTDQALEVGTGSGYQTAILAEIINEVYSIEIVEPLAIAARERLGRLGYTNAHVRFGDGYQGWAGQAPFDAIIVTAAAEHVPPPLIEQLKRGGRLVIPVGGTDAGQMLVLLEKDESGHLSSHNIIPVRFVPFTRTTVKE